MSYEEREIRIGEVKQLLDDGYQVEVESPDGWVGVNHFVDKGMWDEYVVTTLNGFVVRCNEKHLFKSSLGYWISAAEMYQLSQNNVSVTLNTRKGPSISSIEKTGQLIPIVDINVDHENHRYYTSGIESHNTGVGKSLFMCHCASFNLTQGKNVLYITLEMSEEKIAERIDANLLNVTVDELAILPKDVYDKKINRIKEKTVGKLIIKEYPTATAGSANFRHLINELRIKRNFTPDVIYIDYLNICSSSRIKAGANVNTYQYVKAIAEELRGLAVEFNVPVVSATQTTRSGYGNSDVELTDTSESFGLPATADLMFALISTEDLEGLNQIMVKQLKNRYNDPTIYKRFVVGIDRAKMRLYDCEQEAQNDIVDDRPVFDKSKTNERLTEEKKSKFKDLFV